MPLRKKKTRRVIGKTRRKSSKRFGGMLRSREDLQKIINKKISADKLRFAASGILDMAYSKYWGYAVEPTFRKMLDSETEIKYTYYDQNSRQIKEIIIAAESVQEIKENLYPPPSQTTTSQLGNSHDNKRQHLDMFTPANTPSLLRPQTRNQTQTDGQKVFDTHFDKYIIELNQVVESICETKTLYVMFHSILKLIDELEQKQTFDSYSFIKMQIQKLVSKVHKFEPYAKIDFEIENDLYDNTQFYAEVVRNLVKSYKGGPNVLDFIEVLKNFVYEHSTYCDRLHSVHSA